MNKKEAAENLLPVFIEISHDLNDMHIKLKPYCVKALLMNLDYFALSLTEALGWDMITQLMESNQKFKEATLIHTRLNNIYRNESHNSDCNQA